MAIPHDNAPTERSEDASFVDLAIRLALLAALVYWTLIIIQPLLAMVIWSVVVAVALYPLFEWLAGALGGQRRLAAIIVTLCCVLIVLGPMAWAGLSLLEGAQAVSRHLEQGDLAFPSPAEGLRKLPLVGEQLYELWALASTNFKAAFAKLAPQLRPIGGSLVSVAGTASTGLLTFIASVVIAGFLLVPGPALVNAVKVFARRIIARRADEFVDLMGLTIRNVSRGVIGIAILQAALAGLGMAATHIPGAAFITFVVLVLGIIQIGPSILLIPVIVWTWASKETTIALLFTAYMVPVCLVDNVLRPVVMGRGMTTPMPVVFVGLVGGVLAHGVIGVFIGPIVLAVAWGLLLSWVGGEERAAALPGPVEVSSA